MTRNIYHLCYSELHSGIGLGLYSVGDSDETAGPRESRCLQVCELLSYRLLSWVREEKVHFLLTRLDSL
jgi:hypothetical protein